MNEPVQSMAVGEYTDTPSSDGHRSHTILLKENIGIGDANGLYAELGSALLQGKEISLDGSDVEKVDAAILQVLLAFAREMVLRQGTVRWSAASDPLKEAASLLGLNALLGLVVVT